MGDKLLAQAFSVGPLSGCKLIRKDKVHHVIQVLLNHCMLPVGMLPLFQMGVDSISKPFVSIFCLHDLSSRIYIILPIGAYCEKSYL
ncbi:hypothetical protein D8674_017066 [Pyrus ussuriensis x Pyrus communis]|uniref:Uncharacterized protein n=1 Tax=Pyrus ussuriensis x Pyrus communis TaxID=2448454 RepID=A0A5N5HBM9_9ROSA|nr:hypothetical protein D8674_017066 [Pyrus ussuriensis x Pyrus communis]